MPYRGDNRIQEWIFQEAFHDRNKRHTYENAPYPGDSFRTEIIRPAGRSVTTAATAL
jgi:hypothetical protein